MDRGMKIALAIVGTPMVIGALGLGGSILLSPTGNLLGAAITAILAIVAMIGLVAQAIAVTYISVRLGIARPKPKDEWGNVDWYSTDEVGKQLTKSLPKDIRNRYKVSVTKN